MKLWGRGAGLLCVVGLVGLVLYARGRVASVRDAHIAQSGVFHDVTRGAGLDFRYDNDASPQKRFIETTGGGVAFLDFDQDGLLDIFAVQGGPAPGSPARSRPTCKLYRNRGDGTFADVTVASGLAGDYGYGQGVAVADYNNDGWPALLITGYGGVHLLRNDHGKFIDVTAQAGLLEKGGPHWSTSAVWLDYDRDGWLDLLVCRYASWFPDAEQPCADQDDRPMYCAPTQYPGDSCVLYHNNRNGTFTDVTARAGLGALRGRALGAVSLDYDFDGWPDLFVTHDLAPNWLLHNMRNGTFQEVGTAAGVAVGPEGQPLSGMGVAVGDFEGTGRESLFVGNFSHQPRSYYLNQGDGTFRWAGPWAGVGESKQPYLAFAAESLDYDLDGHLDVAVGNGHINDNVDRIRGDVTYREPQQLLHNRGDGRFEEELSQEGGLRLPRVTRGLAVGDYENSGRASVLVSGPNEPLALFRNTGAAGRHWIGFRLQGTHSNRDGIGAVVKLRTGLLRQMRVVHSGSSYCSHSDIRPLFGLETATTAEDIEIIWPSGLKQRLSSLPADHYYLVVEGGPCVPDPRLLPH